MAKYFASDNYSPVDPVILKAITKENDSYARPYGADKTTKELEELVREQFGPNASIFPCSNGTGANVTALQALSKRYEGVITPSTSHLNVDEGGSPEKFGLKLHLTNSLQGRMRIEDLESQAWGYGDQHRAQPSILSITQSTELGTVYSKLELKGLIERAKKDKIKIHIDGARIFNALAHLQENLSYLQRLNIDALSLGGTKNGALAAEAIILFNPEYEEAVKYLRKSTTQLLSKQRFISAQLLALLKDDHWRENALNANIMAKYLRTSLEGVEEINFAYPTESNAVFAYLPPKLAEVLSEEFSFYIWDASTGLVRWMTSWDTQEEDVDLFVTNLKSAILRNK